jgi:small conductance mechanosensitive channel|tara:strand:+ start:970 stop:2007 length:1038 start_codon:yes stop_codon:yes gene_type:complete
MERTISCNLRKYQRCKRFISPTRLHLWHNEAEAQKQPATRPIPSAGMVSVETMDGKPTTDIAAYFDLSDVAVEQFLGLVTAYGLNFLAAVFTLFLGIWLSRRASRLTGEWLSRLNRLDKTLVPIMAALVRYAGLTLTIIVTLGNFGVETTSIIAVLGAAGLAVGLALQGTLSNVAAGLMLLFLRPFRIGDWVEAAGVSGSVREIGLFTTTIDTFDNVFISIPNSSIWSSNIINHARYGTRRMDLDIGIGYDSNLDTAETALMSLATDPRVLADPAPRFLVVSYGDSAINVRLRAYASYDDFFDLYWDLNRRLKGVLDDHGIDIPFPQRVVHHMGNGSDSAGDDGG